MTPPWKQSLGQMNGYSSISADWVFVFLFFFNINRGSLLGGVVMYQNVLDAGQ